MKTERSNPMTRDEALLVLNDHCGDEVEVLVSKDRGGDQESLVVSAKGVLEHWRADVETSLPRDDISGLYDVGSGSRDQRASIDITDLGEARPMLLEDEMYGLAFTLAERLTMTVVWGIDESDD